MIESDMTLTADTIYTALGSIIVSSGVTLTIPEGVRLYLAPDADLRVAGNLQITGNEASPVRIGSRLPGQRWGAIALVDAEGVSRFSHVVLRDGSLGADPVLERGAISIVRSKVEMDHLDMDDVLLPIFGWESKVTLRSSNIHTPFTGDGINVKHGEGLVEDCSFLGNTAPDTDAIDFDDVVNGVIRNNRIYAFRGPNSDGIDVGEGCVDLLVTRNRIFNNSDKGISVGQASTVRIERNLIVGCALGVGIKDTGSMAWIDQNTFARCDVGVAVFEKNLGAGGGRAEVTNTIFSRSKDAPVTVDSLSSLSVAYSLSDTLPLDGANNLTGDPGFADVSAYDFSLVPSSPARDAGDPFHSRDDDGSRADMGAYYVYDSNDYPFQVPNVIVINEILSHSEEGTPDWIELHNTSATPVDIGGWFLSDSKSDLRKYQIAADTVLLPNGYLVFYENETFGEMSQDSGKRTAFALNENGDTVYLFAPGEGILLDYSEEETFGPSPTGVSKGRYLKSTNTYNFVAMTEPTPGASNSAPVVGPIVISEILYHPLQDGDAEYLELANISEDPVTLYDPDKATGWRFTDGIVFDFPTEEPITLAAGERLLMVRDEAALRARFLNVSSATQIFQWHDSGLSNGGERLELSRPGDIDELGNRQWVRIDRVNYGDGDLWPTEADGGGPSLRRIDERAYGNDVANWMASEPTPGTGTDEGPETQGFEAWASSHGVGTFGQDSDGDGLSNGLEYALGLNPGVASTLPPLELTPTGNTLEISITLFQAQPNITYTIEISEDLIDWNKVETNIEGDSPALVSGAVVRPEWSTRFIRLHILGN